MAFFRACCRQSASTLDSPSSKERPSASAIAAMFPNDAAAICPPKMRLTVGMETPLRDAKLWNPIPSIFRRFCSRSAVIGRIFLMVFSYHIRYIFRNQAKGAFLLLEDLHQKSRSGSNQYKFLVVGVLRFWGIGTTPPLAQDCHHAKSKTRHTATS